MFLYRPSGREYNKIGYGCTIFGTGTGQDRENTRITMIKTDRVNNIKFGQIIFIRYIVAMPGYNIETGMILFGYK